MNRKLFRITEKKYCTKVYYVIAEHPTQAVEKLDKSLRHRGYYGLDVEKIEYVCCENLGGLVVEVSDDNIK